MTTNPLQEHLFSLNMHDALAMYDKVKDIKHVRTMCQLDLFYLLVKVCHREDMKKEWVYERCREVQSAPDGHLDLWAR